jgi:hypothetical protein
LLLPCPSTKPERILTLNDRVLSPAAKSFREIFRALRDDNARQADELQTLDALPFLAGDSGLPKDA